MTDNDLQGPLDVRQAALLAQVSPVTVRWWASQGLLPSIKVEGKLYFKTIDVLVCEQKQRTKAKSRKGGNRRRNALP